MLLAIVILTASVIRPGLPYHTYGDNEWKVTFRKASHLAFPVSVRAVCWTLCSPMDCTHQAPLSMGFSRQE